MNALTIYVVYDHPRDFPEHYVIRRQHIAAGGITTIDSEPLVMGKDLEVLRLSLQRLGLTCLQRHPSDDPVIVETWL